MASDGLCKSCNKYKKNVEWWSCCPIHFERFGKVCKECKEIFHPDSSEPIMERTNFNIHGDGNFIQRIVSPDAEVVTNEAGGSQSHLPIRLDLFDAKAMFATAAVLHEGAEKYSPGNWRSISTRDHLNHLLSHVYAYLDGDRTDDHLSHAVCRAMFALGRELDPEAKSEKDNTLT